MTNYDETVEAISYLLDMCKDALDTTRDPDIRRELVAAARSAFVAKELVTAARQRDVHARLAS